MHVCRNRVDSLQPHGLCQTPQEFCSGLPFPTPGDLLDPGVEPVSLVSPAMAGESFTTAPPGKTAVLWRCNVENISLSYKAKGLPWWLRWQRLHLQGGRPGFQPWLRKILWRGNGNPLQYSCLEDFHGERSLVGYSSWGHKEVDTTERLTPSLSLSIKHKHACFFFIRNKDLQGWDSDSFTTCTVSNALRQKKVEGLLPLCS